MYLGKLWLGEARLAHLRGLAHGDVALCQWPLGERLGGPILADLAVTMTTTLVPRATDPLPPATPGFTLHSSTTFNKNIRLNNKKCVLHAYVFLDILTIK